MAYLCWTSAKSAEGKESRVDSTKKRWIFGQNLMILGKLKQQKLDGSNKNADKFGEIEATKHRWKTSIFKNQP